MLLNCIYENILDGHLCEMVDVDKIYYGLMPERGTVDAVFVLRRLKNKKKKMRSCCLYLLNWKRPLIACQEKLFLF